MSVTLMLNRLSKDNDRLKAEIKVWKERVTRERELKECFREELNQVKAELKRAEELFGKK